MSYLMAFRSADIGPEQEADSAANLARALAGLRARAGATLKRELPDVDAFPPLAPPDGDANAPTYLQPFTDTEMEKCPGQAFQRPRAVPSKDDMEATAQRHQLSHHTGPCSWRPGSTRLASHMDRLYGKDSRGGCAC